MHIVISTVVVKTIKMEQTQRLILAIPVQEDFQRFYEIQSDPQTNLFNPKGAMNYDTAVKSFEGFLDHWTKHAFGSWAIKLKTTGSIIGFGGLSYRLYGEEIKVNVGYRFDTSAWGKGYATELTLHSIKYGFQQLNFDKIFALVRPKNAASIRVLEKCNMQRFGTLDDVPGSEQSLVFVITR